MKKKYVVKDFEPQTYYCGDDYRWTKDVYFAHYFDSVDDAEGFIERENGRFQIEMVYVVQYCR